MSARCQRRAVLRPLFARISTINDTTANRMFKKKRLISCVVNVTSKVRAQNVEDGPAAEEEPADAARFALAFSANAA